MDLYKIEILHYLHPQLIWAEVVEHGALPAYEQIGIYGIIPIEHSIDIEEDAVKLRRSAKWTPGVNVVLAEALVDAENIVFVPAYIDRRISIFEDNIHKYGEIIITYKNGTTKKLSKIFSKARLALFDEAHFHKRLASGKLRTDLKSNEITQVLEAIDMYKSKKEARKKQEEHMEEIRLMTAQEQMFEDETYHCKKNALTEKNLQRHNQFLDKDFGKKNLDLNFFNDKDEESLGRATSRKRSGSDTQNSVTDASLLLQKKLELIKKSARTPQRANINETISSENDKNSSSEQNNFEEASIKTNSLKKILELKASVKKDILQNANLPKKTDTISENPSAAMKSVPIVEIRKEDNTTETPMRQNYNREVSNTPGCDEILYVHRKPKRKSPKVHLPKQQSYDPATQIRVAYGPPEFDRKLLQTKIIPISDFVDTTNISVEEDIQVVTPQRGDYDELDSNVNLAITNKESLQHKVNETTSKEIKHQVGEHIVKETNKANEVIKHKAKENTVQEIVAKITIAKVNKDCFDKNANNNIGTEENYAEDRECTEDLTEHEAEKTTDEAVMKNKSITPSKDEVASSSRSRLQRLINLKRVDTPGKPASADKKVSCIGGETSKKPENMSDSDEESLAEIVKKLTAEYEAIQVSPKLETVKPVQKNYVNPFKNLDVHFSRFVDKITEPVLMFHSAMNLRIEPIFLMRDVCFDDRIQTKLKNIGVERPMTIQTVSWFCVLRGYSLFMIGPKCSGKTLGYIPSVCLLLSVNDTLSEVECKGPMCIIVCATAVSVAEAEKLAHLLSYDKKILALYTGMTDLDVTTSLYNGCDLLICTPSILFRLLQSSDFGVDLRRLTTFVLDDCERLCVVYASEIVYFQKKIKEMLKNRVAKELQVQYIVVSRIWCDFMEPLAKTAPNPVVCISAFQECVLYSRANTTVSFVTKENKDKAVLEFLKDIKPCKKTVIVCREDEEVNHLQKILTKAKYNVLACNNTMDLQELVDLSGSLNKYHDSVLGLILICCDGNIEHLNITDENYLVHYSLPTLFSMFCKRFSVLNENYASIFKDQNEDLKIKILLEESNVEQLPKILHFIKRCTTSIPESLNEICDRVVAEKDAAKAEKLVPVCDSLLALGECPDPWNCRGRHVLFKEYDEPKDWMPKSGEVTFKILHYQNAIQYSARLLTNITDGQENKYAQTYSKLAMKMAMYFATESNKKLHGTPKVGDICALAIKNNSFSRCQVVEILSYYERGNPNHVLIKLIDDEKLERSRDIYLYYLPEEMKKMETHTIQVRLAGVKPKDKDITFSKLTSDHLNAITSADEDLYLKGHVALTVGNCVFVDTLETCKDLTFSGTVIRHDLKEELLNRFATTNPEHIPKLQKLCQAAKLEVLTHEKQDLTTVVQPEKELPEIRWAYLGTDELSVTVFTTAIDPGTFFVRLVKFEDLMFGLCKDIQAYIAQGFEPISHIKKGDIVLAKLPDDGMYERARIDEVIRENKVRCFFVDQGDWRDLALTDLAPITDKFITRLPFQAIECRLFGVRPPGEEWSDFSNVWFTNNLENDDATKQLYIKYFTKESAQFTGGSKYGVAIIDTNTDVDVIINQAMVDLNMARENEDEMRQILELESTLNMREKIQKPEELSEDENDEDWVNIPKRNSVTSEETNMQLEKLATTAKKEKDPYAFSDDDDDNSFSSGAWSCHLNEDFTNLIQPQISDKIKVLDSDSDSKSISVIDSPILEKYPQCLRSITNSKSQVTKPMINSPKPSISKPKPSSKSSSEVSVSIINSSIKSDISKSLDSDDLTSPEPSEKIKELEKSTAVTITTKEIEELRKPKLAWRQTSNKIFVKILIICDEYELKIEERSLTFSSTANDTNYGFDIELYGVVNSNESKHENKGQYILVSLTKVLARNWLSLTKDVGLKKWIVYDVDSLDVSSDEETDTCIVPQISGLTESDSDDDDFRDDINFGYSR